MEKQARNQENLNLLEISTQSKNLDKIYKLSNPVVYYAALVEKSLIFFAYGIMYYLVGLYLNIFCNSNNYNCSIDSKKHIQADMSSINYVFSILAYLTYPLTVQFNSKVVYNLSKLLFGASILLFCYGGFWGMYIGRVLMGFFAEYGHVIAHWMLYQIALPQHREAAIATMMMSMAMYAITFSYFSYLDKGGYWSWRIVNSGPAVLLIIMVFVDITLLRNVNGFDYLLKNNSEEEVIEQLSTYYEKGTAKMLIEENKSRQSQKNHQQELLDLEEQSSADSTKANELTLWERIQKKSNQILNCTIVGICFMLALSDPFLANHAFIGSHLLKNEQHVKASKLMMFYSSIAFFLTSIMLPIFRLNKKRKILLISSLLVCSLCLMVCGLGYKFEQLWLVRTTFVPVAVANGFLYTSYYLYLADICSPGVISIPLVFFRLMAVLTQYLFPVYMSFEDSTMSKISWRFQFLAAVSVVSAVVAHFVMIETDGLTPAEIEKKVSWMGSSRRGRAAAPDF